MRKKKLNAKNLKESLWETLNDVKNGKISPSEADVIASQSREICRVVRCEILISRDSNSLTDEIKDFAGKK